MSVLAPINGLDEDHNAWLLAVSLDRTVNDKRCDPARFLRETSYLIRGLKLKSSEKKAGSFK